MSANREPTVEDWLVIWEAESQIAVAELALRALRALTDEQLRAVVWIGLRDVGWSRVFTELQERGIEL